MREVAVTTYKIKIQKCSLNPFQVFSSATITYRRRRGLSNFYLDYQKNGDDAENDSKNATGCAENDSKKKHRCVCGSAPSAYLLLGLLAGCERPRFLKPRFERARGRKSLERDLPIRSEGMRRLRMLGLVK